MCVVVASSVPRNTPFPSYCDTSPFCAQERREERLGAGISRLRSLAAELGEDADAALREVHESLALLWWVTPGQTRTPTHAHAFKRSLALSAAGCRGQQTRQLKCHARSQPLHAKRVHASSLRTFQTCTLQCMRRDTTARQVLRDVYKLAGSAAPPGSAMQVRLGTGSRACSWRRAQRPTPRCLLLQHMQ